MNDCIFCKIIAGQIPCYKIYEDEQVLAFLDIALDSFGHTLVIPKKHCLNITDCDDDILAHVFKITKKITAHFVKNCGFDGANIVSNIGSQQAVRHLHIHIFPRKPTEKMLTIFEVNSVKVSLEEQQKLLKLTN